MNESTSVRVDKWLWAARFFKTRTLATHAVEGGHVKVNGVRIKPSKEVKADDKLEVAIGDTTWELVVQGVSEKRGPATVARTLYAETAESITRREAAAAQRRFVLEPSDDLRGRPTKRDRRVIEKVRRS